MLVSLDFSGLSAQIGVPLKKFSSVNKLISMTKLTIVRFWKNLRNLTDGERERCKQCRKRHITKYSTTNKTARNLSPLTKWAYSATQEENVKQNLDLHGTHNLFITDKTFQTSEKKHIHSSQPAIPTKICKLNLEITTSISLPARYLSC